jgi:hypothetical protein
MICNALSGVDQILHHAIIWLTKTKKEDAMVNKSMKKRALITATVLSIFTIFSFNANAAVVQKGETLTYKISKFKIKVAEAVLTYQGPVTVDGKEMLLVDFTARGLKFLDEEKIYLDPQTYYPVMIKRDLNIFGSEEQIVEYYDQEKGIVKIVKTVKGETTEEFIEKGRTLENIYGYIYRQRTQGQFSEGEEYDLSMPTRDVTIEYAKEAKLRAAGDAHYYRSKPKKFKLFFDQSEQKIPLRIDGAMGFGSMSMLLTGIKQESEVELSLVQ